MRIFVLISLIIISACNSKKTKDAVSQVGNQVDPNVQAREAAKSFMKGTSADIDPTKQINQNDLNLWTSEGLLTEAEAQALMQNIQ